MIDGISNNNEHAAKALFISLSTATQHFGTTAQCLRDRGWETAMEIEQNHAPLTITQSMMKNVQALYHVDSTTNNSKKIYDFAKQFSIPVALQLDGVVEYSNTFLNTKSGTHFLRPAPCDLVFAASEHDRIILESLGNKSVATGLPRFDLLQAENSSIQKPIEHNSGRVLIATANNPACTNGARERVLKSLMTLKLELERRRLPVLWRISKEYARILDIENDFSHLGDALASVDFVMTTASTLAVESILAAKPTLIIHPHPWPLWIPSAWVWQPQMLNLIGEDLLAMRKLEAIDQQVNQAVQESLGTILNRQQLSTNDCVESILDSLFAPDCDSLLAQAEVMKKYRFDSASKNVSDEICKLKTTTNHEQIIVPQETQDSKDTSLVNAFLELVNDGYSKVSIATSKSPSNELVNLVNLHHDLIAGFILIDVTHGSQFLGKPAWSHDELIDEQIIDCVLIDQNRQDVVFQTLLSTCMSENAIPCFQNKLPVRSVSSTILSTNHIQDVLNDFKPYAAQKNAYTTLPIGILQAKSYDLEQGISCPDQSMVILRGDEEDFQVFKDLEEYRNHGLVVRSMRWSDAELEAPGSFKSMVESLNNAQYALYGAGAHTQRLLLCSGVSHYPSFIIDDQANIDDLCWGIPVMRLDQIPTDLISELSCIFMSSKQYEDEMFENCAMVFDKSIRRVKLYDSHKIHIAQ